MDTRLLSLQSNDSIASAAISELNLFFLGPPMTEQMPVRRQWNAFSLVGQHGLLISQFSVVLFLAFFAPFFAVSMQITTILCIKKIIRSIKIIRWAKRKLCTFQEFRFLFARFFSFLKMQIWSVFSSSELWTRIKRNVSFYYVFTTRTSFLIGEVRWPETRAPTTIRSSFVIASLYDKQLTIQIQHSSQFQFKLWLWALERCVFVRFCSFSMMSMRYSMRIAWWNDDVKTMCLTCVLFEFMR